LTVDKQESHCNDTIVITDTQFNGQSLLTEEQQAEALNHSSMSHFKIVDILGKGGMGAVYKAKDLALERFVAIKMIRIDNAEQPLMLAEAKTISKLNHPNIVTIYDIARDNDANFIVMEWVNGRSLDAVIPPQGLAVSKVLAYAKQMVAAISCAHQQHIIHRDIKPQNIMVDANESVKILDFGIAALVDTEHPSLVPSSKSPQPQSNAIAIAGSPQYMSPEQINGLPIDARSDLFSLGIVLYEMLTGVKPFLGLNFKQITQAINNGQYTPLAEAHAENSAESNTEYTDVNQNNAKGKYKALPSDVIAVVDKLLQTEPADRYQTADDLAIAIDVIDEKLNKKRNWWQQQHWLTKTLVVLPIIWVLGLSLSSVLFPPTTQELIARQLVESQKIAFLPFDNISGDPVLQIFSDGIATMLSSDLAEVGYQQGDGTTWVLPASDIRHLEDKSVQGIYNKYGVNAIITGSIQHMGSTRSVHLSLVNGADGRQLKSVQLSIDANNLFAAQTQIREHVLDLLGWSVPNELIETFAKSKPTFDGAYKHHLAGQGYLYRFDHADNIHNALVSFNKAIEIDASYADAYAGLAEAQLEKFGESNDISLLIPLGKTIGKLGKIHKNHPSLNYLEGELSLNQGRYDNAAMLFQKSIELNPNFVKAYTGLSISYQNLGERNKAESVLLTAYQLMPNNIAVLIELGAFHYDNGNYDKAITYFELLAKQTPNNFIAYLNISVCHYLKGNIRNAIQAAQKSLEIQHNADSFSNLGTYYFVLRDYDNSVKAFENMIALNDSDYINWGNLADAYRFANNNKYLEAFNKAIIIAEHALKLNPFNKTTITSLSYYYANIGDIEKTEYYAKQINESDLGEDQFFIATAYARVNMKMMAIRYLSYAINNNYSISEISSSPLLDNLRSEGEFLQLIN
jgi:serine/threonine-protein kinase